MNKGRYCKIKGKKQKMHFTDNRFISKILIYSIAAAVRSASPDPCQSEQPTRNEELARNYIFNEIKGMCLGVEKLLLQHQLS